MAISTIRRVLAVMAVLCVGIPASASATVPHNGWGLSIATDEGAYQPLEGPYPLPALGDGFKYLQPKVYRLQTLWNAMDWTGENAKRREEWAKGAEKQIEKAKAQGVELIILTIRAGYPDTVKGGNYTPNAATYEYWVGQLMQKFKKDVDVWGPANEPNHGWVPPINGESAKNLSASLLADYYQAMVKAVAAWDSTALITSPDFHDKPDPATVATYVNNYENAGGGWGNVVAWHPYYSVQSESLNATNKFAELFPSYMNIWVTEIGGPFKEGFNPTKQNEAVDWIINDLGGHSRVTRINYYNMLGTNAEWNTALLNPNLTPRRAWKTWCAAVHGDYADHPDCKEYEASRNLYTVAHDGTGTGKTEMHVVAAPGYTGTTLQTPTPLGTLADVNAEFKLTDWNQDGHQDLAAIVHNGTGTGKTEVHVVAGPSFTTAILQTSTPLGTELDQNVEFELVDWNHDGQQDLMAIVHNGSATGKTDVHVLAGPNFNTALLQTPTVGGAVSDEWVEFELIDWNKDGHQDLMGILHTGGGTGKVEVHVLAGPSFNSWILQTPTPLGTLADANAEFKLTDWNNDGEHDLMAVVHNGTGTGKTEVHVVAGPSFTTAILQAPTIGGVVGDQLVEVELTDLNNDGHRDLMAVLHTGGASGKVEVHTLTGPNFGSWLLNTPTPLGAMLDQNVEFALG